MPTLYSMVTETANRNRILEMCEFRIWFRMGITSTILYRFSPNFASGSGMSSHRRLFVTQTGSSLLILEVCRFWFPQFSGSGEYIFQPISTRSHIRIKFGNADFVFDGEWNRKYKPDFTEVQIPVLVSALDRPAFDRTQLCLYYYVFSERKLTFTFAICCRPSVCLLSVDCHASVCNPRAPQSHR